MKDIIIAFTLFFIVSNLSSQNNEYPFPSLSPKGNIKQIIGNTAIEIEYERPSVRKRKIFGELVPWSKVWRTGAGHCTTIAFDKRVKVGGQSVEPGKYSLFSIPNQNQWIIILNTETSLYGSYGYDQKNDVARFVVIPNKTNRFYETLNIDIEVIPNDAKIFISWADIQISFDVETNTDAEIEKLIHTDLLTKKNNNSNIYAGAAEYLLYQGKDLSDAIKLADHAIELDSNNGWARILKIRIYKNLKLYEQALSEVNEFFKHEETRKYDNEIEKKNTLRELNTYHETISKLMNQ